MEKELCYKNENFTRKANEVVGKAMFMASRMGCGYVGSEHLLYALASKEGSTAGAILKSCCVSDDKIFDWINMNCAKGEPKQLGVDNFTTRLRNIIDTAVEVAYKHSCSRLAGTEHLLFAMLQYTDCIAVRCIEEMHGVNIAECEEVNDKYNNTNNVDNKELLKYSKDLTELARKNRIDPVIGREKEIERTINILLRRTKNNPCLIGEAGVGKTAIAEGIALKIVKGEVPDILKDKRVISMNGAMMVSGCKYRGDFEERMSKFITAVQNLGNIICFLDEIHTLVGMGAAEGAIDAAQILKPYLARGDLHVIGATTLDEYRQTIEKDGALERRFQKVLVDEPTEEQAIEMLQGMKSYYEKYHNVNITEDAICAAVAMSTRYLNDRRLPDKAFDLLDEACVIASRNIEMENNANGFDTDCMTQQGERYRKLFNFVKKRVGTPNDMILENKIIKDVCKKLNKPKGTVAMQEVALAVQKQTEIPLTQLTEDENTRLLRLEDELSKRVIGQSDAVTAVASAIRRSRVGLKDTQRPIGSFLFVGKTGVGKTELSKALAESMFGTEKAMIRFDMSEYMDKESVNKLIGSAPGYVGYENGGLLTEKVRRKPYAVVLFDEVEKAHRDVLNLLLQILEDGVLTDNVGRKVSFSNCIIVMTSNVGACAVKESRSMGFIQTDEPVTNSIMQAVRAKFKPELLGRIDDIIVFNDIAEKDKQAIVRKFLNGLSERALTIGIELEYTAKTVRVLAEESIKESGARNLRSYITHKVEDVLSNNILQGNVKSGDKVVVDYTKKDGFVVKVAEAVAV